MFTVQVKFGFRSKMKVLGDLAEVLKWVKRFNKVVQVEVLTVNENVRTLNNGFKVHKHKFGKEIMKN